MSRAFPFLQARWNSYADYATASVTDLFGERLRSAEVVQIITLDSLLLLNRGEYFVGRALPLVAQLAPANGVAVADFDGDGAADLFLAQNDFSGDREVGRLDTGRGLLLRGDGRGEFRADVPAGSGLVVVDHRGSLRPK